MICSLGDSLKAILEAVCDKRINLAHLPFDLARLPYTKPYHLKQRNE